MFSKCDNPRYRTEPGGVQILSLSNGICLDSRRSSGAVVATNRAVGNSIHYHDVTVTNLAEQCAIVLQSSSFTTLLQPVVSWNVTKIS